MPSGLGALVPGGCREEFDWGMGAVGRAGGRIGGCGNGASWQRRSRDPLLQHREPAQAVFPGAEEMMVCA
jgi:hypothetical protein